MNVTADPKTRQVYNEGFEASANRERLDTFYLGRHVSEAQRKAYISGWNAGKRNR